MTDEPVRIATDRLVLRPWRSAEAHIQREMWTERDARVPAHRRIDADGRPTVEDIARWIDAHPPGAVLGLLAIELAPTGAVVGYCGLIEAPETPGEPELAFELLRRHHGRGYATEASRPILERARAAGVRRLRASVWDWNVASRRVLEKLGFVETDRREPHPEHGVKLFTTLEL